MNALNAAIWIVCYLLLALAPLLVAVSIPVPPGNGFSWDFAVAIGIALFGLVLLHALILLALEPPL